jgi:hypothetical protein
MMAGEQKEAGFGPWADGARRKVLTCAPSEWMPGCRKGRGAAPNLQYSQFHTNL